MSLFRVIRRLKEHQEFFPAFFEIMNKLFEILGILSLHMHFIIISLYNVLIAKTFLL